MKAQEILMYLISFNVAFALIGTMGLFFVAKQPLAYILGITAVEIAVGGVVGFAVVNYFMGGKTQLSPQGFIYSIYSSTYLVAFAKTTEIVANIGPSLPTELQAMFWAIYAIFTLFSMWAFLTGISQMVTGGWKMMK